MITWVAIARTTTDLRCGLHEEAVKAVLPAVREAIVSAGLCDGDGRDNGIDSPCKRAGNPSPGGPTPVPRMDVRARRGHASDARAQLFAARGLKGCAACPLRGRRSARVLDLRRGVDPPVSATPALVKDWR